MQRTVTRYTGVYQRESLTRLFNGRQDVCYDITYKTGSKKAWEKVLQAKALRRNWLFK